MTPNPHVFSTYQPLETSKRITIANGTSVPIVGHGRVNLSPNLCIKQVFHVPHLSANLLSIRQLTKDLNCQAIFSPNLCEFWAMNTRKRIGVSREKDGLYCLTREVLCPSRDQL